MKNIDDEQMDQLVKQMYWHELPHLYDGTQEHPVDDVALLEAWELGDITNEELRDLNAHLDQCYYCSREVAAMIKNDTLTLQNCSFSATSPKPWFSRWQARAWLIVAAAMVMGIVCFHMLNPPRGPEIARNIDLVMEWNSLKDYGYDERGWADGAKGAGDEADQQAEQRFLDQIAQNPEDFKLRFEFGQWLLAEHRMSDAIEQFEIVEMSVPDSAVVFNALGMAWFMKETRHRGDLPITAKDYFLKAAQLAPTDRNILWNLGVCFAVLGDEASAQEYFEKAGDLQ